MQRRGLGPDPPFGPYRDGAFDGRVFLRLTKKRIAKQRRHPGRLQLGAGRSVGLPGHSPGVGEVARPVVSIVGAGSFSQPDATVHSRAKRGPRVGVKPTQTQQASRSPSAGQRQDIAPRPKRREDL